MIGALRYGYWMYAVMSPFKVLLHNHPRAHDDIVISVEEHVTGQNFEAGRISHVY